MGEMLDKTDSLTEAIGDGLRELADTVRELAAAVAESRTATARKLV
jgi:phage-related tail protein